jgi:hypothetical protein
MGVRVGNRLGFYCWITGRHSTYLFDGAGWITDRRGEAVCGTVLKKSFSFHACAYSSRNRF